MKKRTEKQPVDDLFARKLENMSLPPSLDGFARLQARMGQGYPEARVVFWRNPEIQRYMALAACLLLVCVFGWLYLSTDTFESDKKGDMAVNKPPVSSDQKRTGDVTENKSLGNVATVQPTPEQKVQKQLDSESVSGSYAGSDQLTFQQSTKANSQITRTERPARGNSKVAQDVPAVAQSKPAEQIAKVDVKVIPAELTVENQKAGSAVATTTTPKPAPVAERVLVVTIAEPEALVAARQAVKTQSDDKATETVASGTDKAEKEAKPTTLWQQMKRLKQGEVFARKNAGEDERGLIGRAYSGIKQTLDKEKSVKQ
jgi:hypothetical protein